MRLPRAISVEWGVNSSETQIPYCQCKVGGFALVHRLFVAIRPPRMLRETLLAAMGGIPNARWQTNEQLHLTVRFIGEVDRPRAEDIAAALATVHQPRFEIALNGVGQFERNGRIEALWAGVAPHQPLAVLHRKVDQALIRLGLAPEARAYLPHITLARFSRRNAPSVPLDYAWPGLASPLVPIGDFLLYESDLGGEGASYSVVARYLLD